MRFPEYSGNFVSEKPNETMTRQDTRYRDFSRFVEEERTPYDFPACCRSLHVLPGELNELLLRELGACGEDLLLRGGNLICDWPQK